MARNLSPRCLQLGIVGLMVMLGACGSHSKGVDAGRLDDGAGPATDGGLFCSGPSGRSFAIGESYLDSCGKPCACELFAGKPGFACSLTLCIDGGLSLDAAVDTGASPSLDKDAPALDIPEDGPVVSKNSSP